MARPDDTGITPLAFAAGAATLVVVVGAIVWFAIPGPDARHRFVSPGGDQIIEIGENCTEAGCVRVAVHEATASDGSKLRRGCAVEIAEQRPMLVNAQAVWGPDEVTVDIIFADADGMGGTLTLVPARDCTIAE